jgi:hypothetical protein
MGEMMVLGESTDCANPKSAAAEAPKGWTDVTMTSIHSVQKTEKKTNMFSVS